MLLITISDIWKTSMIGFKMFGVNSTDVTRTDELVKFKSAKHFSVVPVKLNAKRCDGSHDLFDPNFVILFLSKLTRIFPGSLGLAF